MRRAFKIILAIFAVLIIVIAAFGAIIFLDVAAYTATGSQTLTPTGTSIGKALVVYDPGLSGAAKGVADKIASDLQAQSYTVTLAGIKSSAAANTTDYGVVIVGGPIYAGSPTVSVKDFLNNLQPGYPIPNGPYFVIRVGVFGSGQGSTTPSDVAMIKNSVPALSDNGSLSNAVVVKIGQSEDLNTRASDFVNQLVN
jgi:flavodoxin